MTRQGASCPCGSRSSVSWLEIWLEARKYIALTQLVW